LSFGKINPVCLIYLYKKRGHFYFERIVIIYILSFLVFFDEEKIERSFSKRIYRNIVTVYNRKLSKKKEENKQPSLWNKIHKWQWEHLCECDRSTQFTQAGNQHSAFIIQQSAKKTIILYRRAANDGRRASNSERASWFRQKPIPDFQKDCL